MKVNVFYYASLTGSIAHKINELPCFGKGCCGLKSWFLHVSYPSDLGQVLSHLWALGSWYVNGFMLCAVFRIAGRRVSKCVNSSAQQQFCSPHPHTLPWGHLTLSCNPNSAGDRSVWNFISLVVKVTVANLDLHVIQEQQLTMNFSIVSLLAVSMSPTTRKVKFNNCSSCCLKV